MSQTCSRNDTVDELKQSLIFTYGTLKRGFANHYLMQDLIAQNDAVYLGSYLTELSYPLVLGPHGIPYLISLPGSGHRVKGELYSVSNRGLARVDELEGTRIGHYERLPIQVHGEDNVGATNGVVSVNAEAYFANRSFGERLWERKGKEGFGEYKEKEGREYVKRENRPEGSSFLNDIHSFLESSFDCG